MAGSAGKLLLRRIMLDTGARRDEQSFIRCPKLVTTGILKC